VDRPAPSLARRPARPRQDGVAERSRQSAGGIMTIGAAAIHRHTDLDGAY
jgi:hypothetical protein